MPRNMGIIGCGTHAQHHAEHYEADFQTHGVWDPDQEAMAKIGGIQYATLEDLLADPCIVAVMICSPDQYHLSQIMMAIEAGKHVFCEKPLLVPGQDMSLLEAAFDLAMEKGLVLTSCHPRRFDRPIMWLKSRISVEGKGRLEFTERFGKVVSFDFDFSYHAPSNLWKHARSLLLDHINHEVDLMNALFGIQSFDAWKLRDGFDHYHVVGKRDDGIAFNFQGTRRLVSHIYPEWCRVRFERGMIELDMMLGIARIHDHDQKTVETVEKLAIDYDGRLERVMSDFKGSQIYPELGYLSKPEMLMNTEAGIVLQQDGLRRIDVRD